MWSSSRNSHPYAFPGAICSQPWYVMMALLKSWGLSDWENVYLYICILLHYKGYLFLFLILSLQSDPESDSDNVRWSSRFRWCMRWLKSKAERWSWLCFWPAAEEVRLQCGERKQVCVTTVGCFFKTFSWGKVGGNPGGCLFTVLLRRMQLLNKDSHKDHDRLLVS